MAGADDPPPGPADVADAGADFAHQPVLRDEVVELFGPVPPGWVIDGTLGGAGHAVALLERHPHLSVLGLDRDPAALAAAGPRLARFGGRARVAHARFDRLAEVAAEAAAAPVSGVLLDLGVSSPQLDRPERGFSYRADAPLDMRMDPGQVLTAADVVNGYEERDLARILRRYGDEAHAGRVARAIVAARPLHRTAELAEVVRDAIPAPARRRGGHPARRAFQALRIEVNGELEVLPTALQASLDITRGGGRIVVLSYHSGEDRLVKGIFRQAETGGCTCPPGLPCACGAVPRARLLRRGARKPSPAEVAANPRAESARLRAVEVLP